jgi:hypothetical protein
MKQYFWTILTIILSFLAPIQGLLLLMMGFVLFDTITGVYTSVKLKGKESFRSGILFNIVPKLFMYLSTIILAYGIDRLIINEIFGMKYILAKILSIIFIYTEIKSIDENSMKLGNRSFWTVLKEIIRRLTNIKKDINKLKE